MVQKGIFSGEIMIEGAACRPCAGGALLKNIAQKLLEAMANSKRGAVGQMIIKGSLLSSFADRIKEPQIISTISHK